MAELDRLLAFAIENAGVRMALATVTSAWGSAPRPQGSHMLVLEDGRFEGSVSGGCVGNAVFQNAAEIIEDGSFRKLRYGITDGSAWAVGLPCGGTIEVMVQPVSDAGFARELFERLYVARNNHEQVRLVTDARGHTGENGDVADFVNLYDPPRRMLIVSAVQIAKSLARMAQQVALRVTVIDPRPAYLTVDRFPA